MREKIIEKLAIAYLNKYNLSNWRFEFDRAKRRFGGCHYRARKITLSKPLCLVNTIDRVKRTILHEIAHALTPNDKGHGKEWQYKMLDMGLPPQRCYTSKDTNIVKGKYKYICLNCDYIVYKHRRLKRSKACRSCCDKYNGGRYTDTYKLKLEG